MIAALAHFEPSPAIGGLIVISGAAIYIACRVWDLRRHPWVPRSGCNGTGIRRSPWNGKAVGPCRKRSHRDGNHMRRRRGSGAG